MNQKYDAIILFGPPGVGKGTQGKILDERGGYFHFSSGEMFRSLDSSTGLGRKVKTLIDRGNYVPDKETIDLVQETLERYISERRYNPDTSYLLFDGVPRTAPQVGMISKFVNVKQLLHLCADEDTLLARLNLRAKQEGREDDANEEKIRKRMGIYIQNTLPLLSGYDPEIIYQVEGDDSISKVNQAILEVILRK